MILLTMLNLESHQVSFTQTLMHAELDDDIYMCLQQGWWHVDNTDEWAIKLKKNLYGLVQATHNWYKALSDVFKASDFINLPMMHVSSWQMMHHHPIHGWLWHIFSNSAIINDLVKALHTDHNLELSDPEPVEDFLGIHIKRQSDGTVHMNQKGLINSILKDLNFLPNELRVKYTPSSQILPHWVNIKTTGLIDQWLLSFFFHLQCINALTQSACTRKSSVT